MTTSRRVRALVLAALTLGLLSCDGGDDDSTADSAASTAAGSRAPTTMADTVPADSAPSVTEPAPASTEPTTEATAADTAPAETAPADTVPAVQAWEQVVPGGDCQCADGSEFSFWVRHADPTKVVVFFQGGGACFSAETCAFGSGTYKSTTGVGDDPTNDGGIFDTSDPRNPVAGYSFVFVPYCTGDVHIGNATTVYSPDLTVHHVGAVNAAAALDYVATTFPDAEQVLVTGESAGSVPTPLYAGELSDLLPDADINVLADGSGAYPDVAAINSVIGANWGTVNAIPPWPENAGQTAETWSFPGLFIQAGHHDPAIVFARHDYAFDETQAVFAALAGIDAAHLVSLIDGNEAQIEAAGVNLASYIAPGDSHTVIGSPGFYTEQVNGVALVDWVTALITGQPVPDVHCTECEAA